MPTFPPVIPISLAQLTAQQNRGCIDQRMYRNNTGLFAFQIVNAATGANIDVTGWTFRMTAKYAIPNPDKQAAFQLDTTSGIVLFNAPLGQLLATLPPNATAQYPDGPVEVDYDLQATDPEGVITTVEMGHLTIVPSVTDTIA